MDLLTLLAIIEAQDQNYDVRNLIVMQAVATAMAAEIPAGFRIDSNEPEWPVAYIELPTGQVSWHLPQHVKPYDGHTTEEKYERIRRLIRDVV